MLYIYGDINKLERKEKKERTENNLQGTEKKKRRRKTYLPHTNMMSEAQRAYQLNT